MRRQQHPAIRSLRGACAAGRVLGEFRRHQGVFGGFGRKLQRGQQLVARVARPVLLVDAGERPVSPRTQGRIAGGDAGGCGEFSARVGQLAIARQQQAERDARLQVDHVILDRRAVALLRRRGLVELILRGTQVVEDASVLRVGGCERSQKVRSLRVVARLECGVRLRARPVLRRRFGLSAEVLRGCQGSAQRECQAEMSHAAVGLIPSTGASQ